MRFLRSWSFSPRDLWKNFLFESMGDSGPTDWICAGTSARPASASRRLANFAVSPLSIGDEVCGDEFALGSPAAAARV